MFYALLVTLVVSGIVAVVFATAFSEQRQSALELDFEDTVHVAEAGAEIFLQRLTDDADDNSGVSGPTTNDVAQWAIDAATAKTTGACDGTYDLCAIDVGEGETVPIRPTGDDAEFVYGVGFTPNRAAWEDGTGDAFVRVVRVQVAFSPSVFAGDVALLAGGNATLSGNFKIEGSNGAVHTNGAIAVNGSGSVEAGISYSGSCTKGCSAEVSGPVEQVPIEEVDPGNVWGTEEAIAIAGAGEWYDYCSGQWYLRAADADGPCDAAKSTTVAAPGGWSGTTYTNNSGGDSNDVFYFDGEVDVTMKKIQGNVTVITDGDIDVGPSANLPPFDARYPGLLFLAGGDISFGGNATGFAPESPALVFANGTIELGGTVEFAEIAFVAKDGANVGTSYKGGGGGSIKYNGGAIADLGGDGFPIVVQWDEVR